MALALDAASQASAARGGVAVRSDQQYASESLDRSGLFLLSGRAARIAVAAALGLAIVTVGAASYRRSDASVRALVRTHRHAIQAAASQYEVDPRLIAAIVYVTHRDQLSPFRDSLERLFISAWMLDIRAEFGIRPPDHVDRAGADVNPMLNRALDISVGLAQIKPRTAQAAGVLAAGNTPARLAETMAQYRDVEAVGYAWDAPGRKVRTSPLPNPAGRYAVADALLDPQANLAMCAMILALYQDQWESANRAWSLRNRPDVLATLYQIGFARSRPHDGPQPNAFGTRVREVYEQPWLEALLGRG